MFRVYLFLDWSKLMELFQKYGFDFSWSSHKKALREKSKPWHERTSVIINGRLPQLRFHDASGTISGSTIIRILFDGIRPKTIVSQTLESYNTFVRKSKN
jgi:hypothetical protein